MSGARKMITVILCVRRAATSQPGRIGAKSIYPAGALKICRSDGVRYAEILDWFHAIDRLEILP